MDSSLPNFADCLTISEAAEILGVSAATLRNWDRSGKLKPRRHPQNGYRIYLHEDLKAVLRSAELPNLDSEPSAPPIDWSSVPNGEHFVQFYESDESLIESVSRYIGTALAADEIGIVCATPDHRIALHRKLAAAGINIEAAEAAGRYLALDAEETLAKLMTDGMPDPRKFEEMSTKLIVPIVNRGHRVRGFGEMVALLWDRGNRDGAIALEGLWNNFGERYPFSTYCAYPISCFKDIEGPVSIEDVCGCHGHIIPAESYTSAESDIDRLAVVSRLQLKANALAAEIEHRHEVERALSARESELADFFENATEGLHKVGPDGTILWANRADYEFLGYAADEYIGHPITEFHADADVIDDILKRLSRYEEIRNYPSRLRCKNGAIKHVLISSNVYQQDGKFLYTRCFTRDITAQVEAEMLLRENDRRKDEFLSKLSHELRNPLAPIASALELLRVAGADEKSRAEAIETIRLQVAQFTRLVDDLLGHELHGSTVGPTAKAQAREAN